MKRILIFGLPGSGKSTLAEKLVEVLGNADWHNADKIRETLKKDKIEAGSRMIGEKLKLQSKGSYKN